MISCILESFQVRVRWGPSAIVQSKYNESFSTVSSFIKNKKRSQDTGKVEWIRFVWNGCNAFDESQGLSNDWSEPTRFHGGKNLLFFHLFGSLCRTSYSNLRFDQEARIHRGQSYEYRKKTINIEFTLLGTWCNFYGLKDFATPIATIHAWPQNHNCKLKIHPQLWFRRLRWGYLRLAVWVTYRKTFGSLVSTLGTNFAEMMFLVLTNNLVWLSIYLWNSVNSLPTNCKDNLANFCYDVRRCFCRRPHSYRQLFFHP